MTVFERTYDAVWPFGQWCAVAMAMKRCGLRSASGPFDWMGGGCPLGAYINMLTTNFAGFFLKENMKKLGDMPGEGTEHWKDMVHGLESRHEFRIGVPFEVNYANFHALIGRRGKRLIASLRSGGKILFVHWIGEGHCRREDVVADMQRLRAAFPESTVDLLVIETEKHAKEVSYEEPESGIVFAIGDFYDQKRFDPVQGNEKLAVSVLRQVRMRGRWKNILYLKLASLRKRLGRVFGGRK